MSDVQPIKDDEIDLFELVEVLWIEKFLIGCFLAVASVIGGLSAYNIELKYETTALYSIVTLPPSRTQEQVVSDLHRAFHSKDTFSQWSEGMPNAKLQLQDVLPTILIDGVTFGSDVLEEAVVSLRDDSVLIKSNKTGLVLDTLDYLPFVADLLSEKYALRSQEEYDRLLALSDRLFERRDRGSLPATFNGLPALERLSKLDTYLSRLRNGAELISISLPSKPVVKSASKKVWLVLSAMIGGFAGVLFVLVRHAYRKQKSMRARLVS